MDSHIIVIVFIVGREEVLIESTNFLIAVSSKGKGEEALVD
jgi:hypothetical protein